MIHWLHHMVRRVRRRPSSVIAPDLETACYLRTDEMRDDESYDRALTLVRERLSAAAAREWATAALHAFDRDPARFMVMQSQGELERLETAVELGRRWSELEAAGLSSDRAFEQLTQELAGEWPTFDRADSAGINQREGRQ